MLKNFCLISILACLISCSSVGKIPLNLNQNLTPVNVIAEQINYKGKAAIKAQAKENGPSSIIILNDLNFTNGVIEMEISAMRSKGASRMSRGFVGLAFNVDEDEKSFDCFYLRLANGRAENQLQRNHSVQYISNPGFEWHKLREETPGKYESYVDLKLGEWTKIKIVVKNKTAQLFVHGSDQPTLIVNELLGQNNGGGIALWLAGGTDAYYANLKITPSN